MKSTFLLSTNPAASPRQHAAGNITSDSIARFAFFDGMPPAHRAVLCEGARVVQFKAGDVMFREGDPADRCFLIESGRIAVGAHEPGHSTVSVQTLGAGEVVGWSWLFPPFAWHFEATALEPTRVLALNGAHLLACAERDHDFGYELMKRVAQIVIRRLQATRQLWLTPPADSPLMD